MTTLNISLPEAMRQFVEEQVASGDYKTASHYIQELIRAAQKRAEADARLEELLLEGLDSGPGIDVTPEFWEKMRSELIERYREGAGR
jgi:antitoxin ParD1/3/4